MPWLPARSCSVYVVLEWTSFIHEHKGVPVTPWNPGLGVAFGVIVLRGPAYGLVLLVCVLIAEISCCRPISPGR